MPAIEIPFTSFVINTGIEGQEPISYRIDLIDAFETIIELEKDSALSGRERLDKFRKFLKDATGLESSYAAADAIYDGVCAEYQRVKKERAASLSS